ncbi:hypothetical protein ACIGW1_01110 [Streptomyces sp. NPDC053780]|uniref:hypothetical protein n=1 Tax=unclassified Streptomyces TaxID=2593676 RepID=UPI003449A4B7
MGSSPEVLGRECDRVIPRSISSWETYLEVIEVPRPVCAVSGTMPSRAMVSWMNSSARRADSTRSMM